MKNSLNLIIVGEPIERDEKGVNVLDQNLQFVICREFRIIKLLLRYLE